MFFLFFCVCNACGEIKLIKIAIYSCPHFSFMYFFSRPSWGHWRRTTRSGWIK